MDSNEYSYSYSYRAEVSTVHDFCASQDDGSSRGTVSREEETDGTAVNTTACLKKGLPGKIQNQRVVSWTY